jgi:hypothetical protein
MFGRYERDEAIRNNLRDTLTNNPLHFITHNEIDKICGWQGIRTHENTWVTLLRMNTVYFPRMDISGRMISIVGEAGVFYDPHPSERRLKIQGWRDGNSSAYPLDAPEQELFTLMSSVDVFLNKNNNPKALQVISLTGYELLLFFLEARLKGNGVTSQEILEQKMYKNTNLSPKTMYIDRCRLHTLLNNETNGRWNIGKNPSSHGRFSMFSLEYTPTV